MPLRYLILALTMRCNLQCLYCYNGEPSEVDEMPEAVMVRAISLAADSGTPFHLQLTGGEPTLVPASMEKAITLAHATGICRSIGIQTNATCLTPDLIDLFRAYKIEVGVSLDGPPSVHHQQRGMAAETLRGLHLLETAGIPFRVTTVVTQANAAQLDGLVLTLAGLAYARGIGLDLLVNKGRAKNQGRVSSADRHCLAKGLQRMLSTLNAINARRSTPIRLRERDWVISAKNKDKSVFCHACRAESMAVQPDGGIFPCGQTMGDAHFAAGTVWAPRLDKLKSLSNDKPKNTLCSSCALESACPGDCPSRLHYNRNENPARICDLYQTLWQIIKGDK
ncbi:MAG: radical SAM protein [Desulfobacteraceae bacterium]